MSTSGRFPGNTDWNFEIVEFLSFSNWWIWSGVTIKMYLLFKSLNICLTPLSRKWFVSALRCFDNDPKIKNIFWVTQSRLISHRDELLPRKWPTGFFEVSWGRIAYRDSIRVIEHTPIARSVTYLAPPWWVSVYNISYRRVFGRQNGTFY